MAGLEGRDAVVNLIEFLFYQDKAVVDKTGSIVGNLFLLLKPSFIIYADDCAEHLLSSLWGDILILYIYDC